MKNDALLKKINSFCKLAIYSDRSEFLTALAENKINSDQLPESLKGNFIADSSMFDGVGKGSDWNGRADLSTEKKSLLDAATYSNVGLDLDHILSLYDSAISKVKSVSSNENNTPISNLIEHRKQLKNYLESLNYNVNKAKPNSGETSSEITMSPTTIVGKYPEISKEHQIALDKILSVDGKIAPNSLKIDGVLGPQTRKALDLFKNIHNDYSESDETALAGLDLLSKLPKYNVAPVKKEENEKIKSWQIALNKIFFGEDKKIPENGVMNKETITALNEFKKQNPRNKGEWNINDLGDYAVMTSKDERHL